MNTTTLKKVQDKCNLYGLEFERGKFTQGARYKVALNLPEKKPLYWPCKTLAQCMEAIYQADYLRHHNLVMQ